MSMSIVPGLGHPRMTFPPPSSSLTSSFSSCASSTAASVFSFEASSVSSSASSLDSISENECSDGFSRKRPAPAMLDRLVITTEKTVYESEQFRQDDVIVVPQEQRQNPRRCGRIGEGVPGNVPSLVRQGERKLHFVDNLVDSATQIVEAIWPLSVSPGRCDYPQANKVLPLRRFIEETLRRSRTSYSTLQVALYYLVVIRPHVPKHDFTMEQTEETHALRALMCGRRMFLAALILASKYLQDKNYSAKAWSKLSGLPISEINSNEMIFLASVNWKLHITEKVFQRWSDIVLKYTPTQPPSSPSCSPIQLENSWAAVIHKLSPELDHPELCQSTVSPSIRTFEPKLARTSATLGHLYSPPSTLETIPQGYTSHSPVALYTPPSTGFCTPAVSAIGLSQRPSISNAFAQAQAACTNRTLDRFQLVNRVPLVSPPQSQACGRRSSLATCSVVSSPESMVSDVSTSSRSSRSSSISSVSSAVCAPMAATLARQAACRNAKLYQHGVATVIMDDTMPMDFTASPDSYTTDFGNFSLNTPCLTSTPKDMRTVHLARSREYTPSSPLSPTALPGRKRGRPASDDLQAQVRQLMARDLVSLSTARTEALASQQPMQQDKGRKRACREDQPPARGPGMWDSLLS